MLEHYLELMTDPAHTAVEFTFVLIDVLVIDFVRRRIIRHLHRDVAARGGRPGRHDPQVGAAQMGGDECGPFVDTAREERHRTVYHGRR